MNPDWVEGHRASARADRRRSRGALRRCRQERTGIVGDQVRARWCGRLGRRRCGADLTDECVRWLGRRSRGLGGDEHVGDHRLVVPLVSSPHSSPKTCVCPATPHAGVVVVSIICALCTSLLNVDALTSWSFESPMRFWTLFWSPKTERRAAAMPPITIGRMTTVITNSISVNPSFAACGRWAFEPDSSAHPTADSDQRVRGSLAAAHRSSFPYDPEVTRDRTIGTAGVPTGSTISVRAWFHPRAREQASPR